MDNSYLRNVNLLGANGKPAPSAADLVEADDAAWFAARPGVLWRIRPYVTCESPTDALVTVVELLESGARLRHCWSGATYAEMRQMALGEQLAFQMPDGRVITTVWE